MLKQGTQSKKISEELGIVAISTGDIFRENIKGGTALGQEAQRYVEAGNLVPDSLTNRLVEDRLAWEDAADGFLLDGYPATSLRSKRSTGSSPASEPVSTWS